MAERPTVVGISRRRSVVLLLLQGRSFLVPGPFQKDFFAFAQAGKDLRIVAVALSRGYFTLLLFAVLTQNVNERFFVFLVNRGSGDGNGFFLGIGDEFDAAGHAGHEAGIAGGPMQSDLSG